LAQIFVLRGINPMST